MATDDLKLAPRRAPQGPELEVLMRIYGYRHTRTGGIAGTEMSTDTADILTAEAFGWPVRLMERFTGTEVLTRSIEAVSNLGEDEVLSAWVAGLHSLPRGRQPLISFSWARHLAGAPTGEAGLPDCGLNATPPGIDVTEVLLRIALGWAWNELPFRYLPDLEAGVAEGLPTPTEDDRGRLRALLDLIAAQPSGTTVSVLEKTIARAKIVPRADKYQRYGILVGLAEFGVLSSPNPCRWDRFVSQEEMIAAWAGGPRSDVTPPLSGWRGGFDTGKAARLLSL